MKTINFIPCKLQSNEKVEEQITQIVIKELENSHKQNFKNTLQTIRSTVTKIVEKKFIRSKHI